MVTVTYIIGKTKSSKKWHVRGEDGLSLCGGKPLIAATLEPIELEEYRGKVGSCTICLRMLPFKILGSEIIQSALHKDKEESD